MVDALSLALPSPHTNELFDNIAHLTGTQVDAPRSQGLLTCPSYATRSDEAHGAPELCQRKEESIQGQPCCRAYASWKSLEKMEMASSRV
eukprot:scaffold103289_cov31-Tisochrysis_lutea.AAC.1